MFRPSSDVQFIEALLVHMQKCGKALCSFGINAAIASRLAMPLDLRMVAARLEQGELLFVNCCCRCLIAIR